MFKGISNCWPQGKKKALTLSYDDGNIADRRLVQIFNKNNLKATFHLNSGLMLDEESWRISRHEVKDLYAGHEVAVHSLTHPFLDRCPKDVMLTEVLEDRRNLERLCGYSVRGMSYPMGTYNEDVLTALRASGIVYSRTVEATRSFALPQDFLRWHPTAHQSHGILELADQFLGRNYSLDLFYLWGHSFEYDRESAPATWNLIEEFCEKMSGNDAIWYATNIEIYDYVMAQRSLYFSVDKDRVTNPSALSVWLLAGGVPVEIPGGTTKTL